MGQVPNSFRACNTCNAYHMQVCTTYGSIIVTPAPCQSNMPLFDLEAVFLVQELLWRSTQQDARDTHGITAIHALAFSAYMGARMRPAEGDFSATKLSLRAWLHERGISMESLSARASALQFTRPTQHAIDVTKGPATSSWLDGVSIGGDCGIKDGATGGVKEGAMYGVKLSTDVIQQHTGAVLHVSDLTKLGWVVAPGVTCALITPLGTLAMFPTRHLNPRHLRESVAEGCHTTMVQHQRPRLFSYWSQVAARGRHVDHEWRYITGPCTATCCMSMCVQCSLLSYGKCHILCVANAVNHSIRQTFLLS